MKKNINTELNVNNTELQIDNSIRPSSLDKYIGQEDLKKILKISISSAKERNESLDHLLFYGPPGLGKTTIANIIANEMKANIRKTSGPIIEKPGELAGMLSSLNEHDILFIDEIHRLPKNVEELLYSAMEDFEFSITIGEGEQTKAIQIHLPHFTLIGATTRVGMLSKPLRDRFGIVYKMESYTNDELSLIAKQTLKTLNFDTDIIELKNLAIASRGTPRIVNNLCKRVRDFAYADKKKIITAEIIEKALKISKIDKNGLCNTDIAILKLIYDNNNKPIGLSTIAAVLNEDEQTITEVNEPFLMQNGYLLKTPKGRILTDYGMNYMLTNK